VVALADFLALRTLLLRDSCFLIFLPATPSAPL
jgi:hypothetical protein